MYWRNVWAFVYSSVRNPHVASDLTQDVFVAAYTKLHQLRDVNLVKSWLFTIARNRCSDHRKSAWLRRVTLTYSSDLFERPDADEVGSTERIEADSLWQSVLGLPRKHREVILLRFREDLPFPEIALILGVNEGAVRSRYRRGLLQLREALHRGGESSEHRRRALDSNETIACPRSNR